jgi:hypothetical protein
MMLTQNWLWIMSNGGCTGKNVNCFNIYINDQSHPCDYLHLNSLGPKRNLPNVCDNVRFIIRLFILTFSFFLGYIWCTQLFVK